MVLDFGNEVKWIPVSSTARALKVSKQRVYKLVKNGVLRSVLMDGNRLISLRSVNDLITLRAKKERK